MPTTLHASLDVYLRSSYEPDAEYVDGKIEERPMGENDHSAWQEAICFWFRQHAHAWQIRVRPELRVQVAAARFRVPDVVILDQSQPIEQIVTHPPLAVFEVLSPEDSLQRLMRKLQDYETMGIAQIWAIDPQESAYYRYQARQLLRQDSFSFPAKGISFDLDRIKEQIN